MSERPMTWDDLPDADQAATGDGRVVAWAINALTLEINALRLALAAPDSSRAAPDRTGEA
jgi:hypothetical protein